MTTRVVGAVLALWSFGFACVHVAWALGWRAGMPDSFPPISERPVFLVYDLLAAAAMYGASVVAWVVARGRVTPRVHRVLLRATLVGSAVALARGVPALVWDAVTRAPWGLGLAADVWFTAAGLLGLVLWRRASRPDDR